MVRGREGLRLKRLGEGERETRENGLEGVVDWQEREGKGVWGEGKGEPDGEKVGREHERG